MPSKTILTVELFPCWWADDTRMNLVEVYGDRYRADGIMVALIKLAQAYWCNSKNPHELIPADEIKKLPMFEKLVPCGVLKAHGESFYLCGSEEHFAWWDRCVAKSRRASERRVSKASPAGDQQVTSRTPAGDQQVTSRTPAGDQQDTLLPLPLLLPEEEEEKKKSSSNRSEGPTAFEPIVEFRSASEDSLLRLCTPQLQRKWVETYRDAAWILQESKKADAWLLANTHKPKKHKGRYFGSWLERASKFLPSVKAGASKAPILFTNFSEHG